MCNQKRKDNALLFGKFRANGNQDQYNKRVHLVNQEDYYEDEEFFAVLDVEGDEVTRPYFMEGYINEIRFKAMIDSGSAVTIFVFDELKSVMKREGTSSEDNRSEKYVNFTGKPLNLLEYIFCEIQLGEQNIKNTSIHSSSKKTNKVNDRQEWLSALQNKFERVMKVS